MNPSDCPEPWVHSPSGVKINSWQDIPVHNVWKNMETGEVVIQYSVDSTDGRREYVEAQLEGNKAQGRLRKIADKLSMNGVEFEFESFVATEGRSIEVCDTQQEAFERAIEYMSEE